MNHRTSIFALTISLCTCGTALAQQRAVSGATKAQQEAMAAFEQSLNEIPSPTLLREWHDKTSSRPHAAGTEGDVANRDMLEREFRAMGYTVERHEFWAYLPSPVSASVKVLTGDEAGEGIELSLREDVLEADPSSSHPELVDAWNAYSGSGVAEGEVVYVNFGRKQDFEKLAAMGVDLTGKIALARYGGNYRGFKAKFAQEAGAAGLLMYTDPADSGYARGLMYPEGGWQTLTSIQRGSIKTLEYSGDPLTPGVEATFNAATLDPATVALPKIPVQPIGWGGANEILSRMDGPAVPGGWQGGLPMTYRITGSAQAVRVRMEVQQKRERVASWNVIATLRGTTWPDELVIVGCHRDAWGMGAGDPDAGMISLLESARSFAEMARRGGQGGGRPKRTIVFGAWGAEEYGIIGSTEWVERNRTRLMQNAVAYLNLDMASMGPNFHSSAHPALHDVIRSAAMDVPQARDAERSVHEAWGKGGVPGIGVLGGGSDHVSFLCYAGVPSVALGGGGSPGTSYHTNYDTLEWYRKVVGDDYEPALMVARMTSAIAARLANAPLLPLDPAAQTRAVLKTMRQMNGELPLEPLIVRAEVIADRADRVHDRLVLLAASGAFRDHELQRANALLRRIDRAWLDEQGLPGRPWYKNLTVSPDPESGYSSWVMPALRDAKGWGPERAGEVASVLSQHDAALSRVEQAITELEALISGG